MSGEYLGPPHRVSHSPSLSVCQWCRPVLGNTFLLWWDRWNLLVPTGARRSVDSCRYPIIPDSRGVGCLQKPEWLFVLVDWPSMDPGRNYCVKCPLWSHYVISSTGIREWGWPPHAVEYWTHHSCYCWWLSHRSAFSWPWAAMKTFFCRESPRYSNMKMFRNESFVS